MHVASLHDRDKRHRLLRRELLLADSRLRTGFFCDIHDRKTQIVHSAVAGIGDPGRARGFLRYQFLHVFRDTMKFLCSDYEIDMRQAFEQRRAARLSHATEKTEHDAQPFLGSTACEIRDNWRNSCLTSQSI